MFLQQSFNKRHIPLANLFGSRSVIAREMERTVVMFKELRLEMRQRVMLAEQSPHTVATVITAMVELMCFHFGKLTNQLLVNHEVLFPIPAW